MADIDVIQVDTTQGNILTDDPGVSLPAVQVEIGHPVTATSAVEINRTSATVAFVVPPLFYQIGAVPRYLKVPYINIG